MPSRNFGLSNDSSKAEHPKLMRGHERLPDCYFSSYLQTLIKICPLLLTSCIHGPIVLATYVWTGSDLLCVMERHLGLPGRRRDT